MAAADAAVAQHVDDAVSPRQNTGVMEQAIRSFGTMDHALDSLTLRADPDAQATVTDFLDFTEYLPSDMTRSLTLIGKLDQSYIDASTSIHELTSTWGKLPTLPQDERPSPVQLRADISEKLNRAVSSRLYAHAEAARMLENVNRHYNRAKTIHAKLETMLENYPKEDEKPKSPVATRSPQVTRAPKITLRTEGGQRIRRPRVPRITVPGEVLAPYELDYESDGDESESSSDESLSPPPRSHNTPQPRIKVLKGARVMKEKVPRPPRQPRAFPAAGTNILALQPPPENAVLGSEDAPWLRLTQWELARLRKDMKKNAAWEPSPTMIAKRLNELGRGPEAYRAAKLKAEAEGQPFDESIPKPESGSQELPQGAISMDAFPAEGSQLSNRGMKLNEAKKLKRDLAKQAAEEAEESARKMVEAVRAFSMSIDAAPPNSAASDGAMKQPPPRSRSSKRKRASVVGAEAEKPEDLEASSQRPAKRNKTETPVPVPVPQHNSSASSAVAHADALPAPQPTPLPTTGVPLSITPVPLPMPHNQEPTTASSSKPPSSPLGSATSAAGSTLTIAVPTKPPADSHIPPPASSPRKSTTPILPPVRETRKRETRKESKEREAPPPIKQSSSRAGSPATTTPGADTAARRPVSRGKTASQEPQPSLAADRPRRTSTARNTPAPEVRQASKRTKRPAPGIVSTTKSGGNSAVGKRKAAPKKKARTARKQDKEVDVEVEVDDEGNVIDPNEPRYCLCNGVSFGMMIQCDNVDNCKQEWFHLECVDLSDVPARTTKWYCPDCRVLLNIGERGEVSARGVKA